MDFDVAGVGRIAATGLKMEDFMAKGLFLDKNNIMFVNSDEGEARRTLKNRDILTCLYILTLAFIEGIELSGGYTFALMGVNEARGL